MDRHASEKEKLKDLPTYKDKDFLGDRRVLCVGSEVRQKLLNVFQADTEVIIVFLLFTFESQNDSISLVDVCKRAAAPPPLPPPPPAPPPVPITTAITSFHLSIFQYRPGQSVLP